jgi:probable rRNA maturation factor
MIKKKARRLLSALDCEGAELSIAFVDDKKMAELNAQWRDVDAPTDVLAFPMDEPDSEVPHAPILGDVVISAERAAEQAAQEGHPLEREIDVLLIHGVLHLLGFDHEGSAEGAQSMALKEAELLQVILSGD